MSLPELRMPLPDFSRWLDDRGHKERGDDAAVFAALADLARRTQEQNPGMLTDTEQSFLRMWQGILFAIVELSNIEVKHGRPPGEIITLMARVCGAGALYAVASILKDDAPLRSVAKVLVEEFRFSAKASADAIMARNAEPRA